MTPHLDKQLDSPHWWSSMAATLNSDPLHKEDWLEDICVLSTKKMVSISLWFPSFLPPLNWSSPLDATIACVNLFWLREYVTRGCVCMWVWSCAKRLHSCIHREGFGQKGCIFLSLRYGMYTVSQSSYTIMCGLYTYGYALSALA